MDTASIEYLEAIAESLTNDALRGIYRNESVFDQSELHAPPLRCERELLQAGMGIGDWFESSVTAAA